MSRLFTLIIVAAVLGVVSAGTVTFVGTCSQNATAQQHLFFNLSNIGNDTAFNLAINPIITGASPPSTFTTNSIGPNQHYAFEINLTNLTALGSYVDYMAVTYQQSSATFSAVFPCLLQFGTTPRSNSVVSYQITNETGGKYLINASIYNFGAYTFNTTVSLVLPAGLTYLTPRTVNLTVPSLETQYAHFLVSNPGSGPSSGVVSSEYSENGVNYASMSVLSLANVVVPPPITVGGSSLSSTDLFIIVAAVVLVLFVALIVRAQLKSKHHKKASTESS